MSNHVRWIRAAGGVVCFALGAIGAVVPLMPTTVFLLCGSYLLVRSAPSLERRLRALPVFQPYARYLDPSVPLPPRARVAALLAMWTSLTASGVAIRLSGGGGRMVLVTLIVLGLAGTAAILLFRRTVRASAAASAGL